MTSFRRDAPAGCSWKPSGPFGIDHGEPFEERDAAQSLIRAHEPIDGGHLVQLEGHTELKGIERADLAMQAVACDQLRARS